MIRALLVGAVFLAFAAWAQSRIRRLDAVQSDDPMFRAVRSELRVAPYAAGAVGVFLIVAAVLRSVA